MTTFICAHDELELSRVIEIRTVYPAQYFDTLEEIGEHYAAKSFESWEYCDDYYDSLKLRGNKS